MSYFAFDYELPRGDDVEDVRVLAYHHVAATHDPDDYSLPQEGVSVVEVVTSDGRGVWLTEAETIDLQQAAEAVR